MTMTETVLFFTVTFIPQTWTTNFFCGFWNLHILTYLFFLLWIIFSLGLFFTRTGRRGDSAPLPYHDIARYNAGITVYLAMTVSQDRQFTTISFSFSLLLAFGDKVLLLHWAPKTCMYNEYPLRGHTTSVQYYVIPVGTRGGRWRSAPNIFIEDFYNEFELMASTREYWVHAVDPFSVGPVGINREAEGTNRN
jgi:hypothetical protein